MKLGKTYEPGDEPDLVSEDEQKEDPDLEKKSLKIIMAIFIGFVVIIISIFLLKGMFLTEPTLDELFQSVLDDGENSYGYLYNGYVFVNYDGLWVTRVRNPEDNKEFTVPLRYSPRDIEDVNIDGDLAFWIDKAIGAKNIMILFDPDSPRFQYLTLANSELSANLVQVLGIVPVVGCTKEAEACKEVPILTCNETNYPVIYLKDTINGSDAEIKQDKNCLTLKGNNIELLKSIDRFLYAGYGIMGAG